MSCLRSAPFSIFFFFNDTATTEIYTLSLHDALPIFGLLRAGLSTWGQRDFPGPRLRQRRESESRGGARSHVEEGSSPRCTLRSEKWRAYCATDSAKVYP